MIEAGFALIILAGILFFNLDEQDPFRQLFAWAFRLVTLMFYIGAALVMAGLGLWLLELVA